MTFFFFFIIFHKGYFWGSLNLKMTSFGFLNAGYSLRQQIKESSATSYILKHAFSCFHRRTADDNFILHLLVHLLTVYTLLFSTLKQQLMHFWVAGTSANSPRLRSSQADCHFSGLCQYFVDGDRIVQTTTQQIPNLRENRPFCHDSEYSVPFAL